MDRRRGNFHDIDSVVPQAVDLAQFTASVKHAPKKHIKTAQERKTRKAATYKRYAQTPRGKYKIQKRRAKLRGVPWELTFEQWALIWVTSGKWTERGTRKDGYVMARFKDKGAYAIGNVEIIRHLDNVAERNKQWRTEEMSDERHKLEAEGETPADPWDPWDEEPPF